MTPLLQFAATHSFSKWLAVFILSIVTTESPRFGQLFGPSAGDASAAVPEPYARYSRNDTSSIVRVSASCSDRVPVTPLLQFAATHSFSKWLAVFILSVITTESPRFSQLFRLSAIVVFRRDESG